jgi:general secretion pathway protein E
MAAEARIYEARGCDECGQTGYKGRIGAFEAVRIDDTLRRLINEGADEAAIAAHAFRSSPDLAAAARSLVEQGVTSAEEAVRITRRDTERPIDDV